MTADLAALSLSALTIGFFHTLYGPDHYVPFVAMSRVGRWSLRKTIAVTVLCGFGHIGSSVLLGFIGIAFGVVVLQLEMIESVRGDLAGWLLAAFGLAYLLWGVWRAVRNQPHRHIHFQDNGTLLEHTHRGQVLHEHGAPTGGPYEAPQASASQSAEPGAAPPARVAQMTPWVLLTIFVFGPCEPLIPLLMYPAAKANAWAVLCVTLLFGAATLVTMTAVVAIMYLGAGALHGVFAHMERYSHALAGLVVLMCGLAILLGL